MKIPLFLLQFYNHFGDGIARFGVGYLRSNVPVAANPCVNLDAFSRTLRPPLFGEQNERQYRHLVPGQAGRRSTGAAFALRSEQPCRAVFGQISASRPRSCGLGIARWFPSRSGRS